MREDSQWGRCCWYMKLADRSCPQLHPQQWHTLWTLKRSYFPPPLPKPTPKYKKETPQIFTWGQRRSLNHTKLFFALVVVVPGCASIEHLCCTNAEWVPHKEYNFHGLQQNSYSSSSFKKQRKTKTESFLKFYSKFQKANIGKKNENAQEGNISKEK